MLEAQETLAYKLKTTSLKRDNTKEIPNILNCGHQICLLNIIKQEELI